MDLSRRLLKEENIEFHAPYRLESFKDTTELESYLNEYAVVMVAQKDMGFEPAIRHLPAMKTIKKYLDNDTTGFSQKVNTYPLPDGDEVFVYRINQWPTCRCR
jgi:hypothetical protein